jgi:hypothetical protein
LARRDRKWSLNDGRIQNPSNPFGIVPLSRFVPRGFGFVHHSIPFSITKCQTLLSHDSQLFHRCMLVPSYFRHLASAPMWCAAGFPPPGLIPKQLGLEDLLKPVSANFALTCTEPGLELTTIAVAPRHSAPRAPPCCSA